MDGRIVFKRNSNKIQFPKRVKDIKLWRAMFANILNVHDPWKKNVEICLLLFIYLFYYI